MMESIHHSRAFVETLYQLDVLRAIRQLRRTGRHVQPLAFDLREPGEQVGELDEVVYTPSKLVIFYVRAGPRARRFWIGHLTSGTYGRRSYLPCFT